MPQNSPDAKNDGSAPGVLGDWTEEQNLGQPGDPKARITKKDVQEAFEQERQEQTQTRLG
jgi:hypothetical protein